MVMALLAACMPAERAHAEEGAVSYATNRGPDDLDEETAQWLDSAGEALSALASERDIMALVYLTDQYDVKVCPPSKAIRWSPC